MHPYTHTYKRACSPYSLALNYSKLGKMKQSIFVCIYKTCMHAYYAFYVHACITVGLSSNHTHIHASMHPHKQTCMLTIHVCIHACILQDKTHACVLITRLTSHSCIHTYTHILYTCTYTHTIHMHICMHAYNSDACIHACMYEGTLGNYPRPAFMHAYTKLHVCA
jgi:hypothetical protein